MSFRIDRKASLQCFWRFSAQNSCWNFFSDFLITRLVEETSLKMYINLLGFSFLLKDCLWGIVYSVLHEDEQDPSTFSSSKSLKVLDILTVFKEFLRDEDDFQQISSGITSYKGKHWFRAVQFWLNSRNVNSREDQILYTLYYYQTLLVTYLLEFLFS